jgi:hypothetical protein
MATVPFSPRRSRTGRQTPDYVHQFLVVLCGTDPLVWRRIQVLSGYSFWDLHVALQDAMGWEDRHLHEFRFFDDAVLLSASSFTEAPKNLNPTQPLPSRRRKSPLRSSLCDSCRTSPRPHMIGWLRIDFVPPNLRRLIVSAENVSAAYPLHGRSAGMLDRRLLGRRCLVRRKGFDSIRLGERLSSSSVKRFAALL